MHLFVVVIQCDKDDAVVSGRKYSSGEASSVDAVIVPVSGGANGGESNDDLRIMGR